VGAGSRHGRRDRRAPSCTCLATSRAAEDGLWGVNAVVPTELLVRKTWLDLRITVHSVAFCCMDAPDLKVVTMNGLSWNEEPSP
jgi:hypothetical protein